MLAVVVAGSHFGAVTQDVLKAPYHADDTVTVTFQSACPRNNVRTGDTFLKVQKLQEDTGEWTTVSNSPANQSAYIFVLWGPTGRSTNHI